MNIRTDIKKEDGWSMLGHTITDQESLEPNYILFYHKKSGIMKGFYFCSEAEPNSNVKWVIESEGDPSSLIPPATKEYNLANNASQMSITSNVLKNSTISSSGSLLYGWNCFSFELPYGTKNNINPILSIQGYNVQQYELEADGKFSGQVIVSSTSSSNSLNSWKSFLNMTSNFSNAANTFAGLFKESDTKPNPQTRSLIGTIGIINLAVSIASNIIEGASFFTSKKENVINRYNFSGNLSINGTILGRLPGLVKSINSFDINKLNNNECVGVWGLTKHPEITINRYGRALEEMYPGTEPPILRKFVRNIILKPNIRKEDVLINPELLPLIKNYKVSINNILCSKKDNVNQRFLLCRYKKIEDGWYCSELQSNDIIANEETFNPLQYVGNGKIPIVYLSFGNSNINYPETYVNVLVEIEYNDGSFLSSSRIFKVNGKIYDNTKDIINLTPKSHSAVFK